MRRYDCRRVGRPYHGPRAMRLRLEDSCALRGLAGRGVAPRARRTTRVATRTSGVCKRGPVGLQDASRLKLAPPACPASEPKEVTAGIRGPDRSAGGG